MNPPASAWWPLAVDRPALSALTRAPEADCVRTLLSGLASRLPDRTAVAGLSHRLVTAVRAQRRQASGVDHLMREFSLSSEEGIALMCLAEALLRIPDRNTVDALIRDKIGGGHWAAHLGHSPSLFVNAAAWGLLVTGKLVHHEGRERLGATLSALVSRCGEPLIRRGMEFAMQLLGEQFVLGETIETALKRARQLEGSGFTHSFDLLGEAALTGPAAEDYTAAYHAAIEAIGIANHGRGPFVGPGISVKLSALHPRYSSLQRVRVMTELYPRLLALARHAARHDLGFNIDAEESERLELSLDLFERLCTEPDLAAWQGLGMVVQAYQKRASAAIAELIGMAQRHDRKLMIRLVKGAYWDSEIKRCQMEGLADYPVFTRKCHTDLSYLACARQLLSATDCIYAQFATHNAHSVAFIHRMAQEDGITHYEFQCLHGMGEALYTTLLSEPGFAQRCRIYAPVGSHRTLLPYLVRRLLENGANSSFVNQIVDPTVSIETLIRDPLERVAQLGGTPHPDVPQPQALFPDGRRNSAGVDLFAAAEQRRFAAALAAQAGPPHTVGPLLAGRERTEYEGQAHPVDNPARLDERLGTWHASTPDDMRYAVDQAGSAAPEWAARTGEARAAVLRCCADALAADQDALISLCVRETGKTWANAVAELREAIDFCRYYATAAAAQSTGSAGITLCISPWNFPLAILVGQITAALAAGRSVLAKPAEQSVLVAHHAVRLLHGAGVPRAVLQLLPGAGEEVGAALVAAPAVGQVLFTGSTDVARRIQRAVLARAGSGPAATLIAETGGQNTLIVDSSALLEQAAQDVLISGFDSAGQRCSALRVLYLQDDIYAPMLALLKDAMRELALGDPREPATDIGPLIDHAAQGTVLCHIERLRAAGAKVHQASAAPAQGCFVPPTLIELDSPALLGAECFGPVVHVLRYASHDLPQVIAEINSSGYGLTFGMHSRIDERIAQTCAGIRAGNLYINRTLVGAVVGVQPFGGEGKSGTGPKAGGPLYVPHLGGGRVTAASTGLAQARPAAAVTGAQQALIELATLRDAPAPAVAQGALSLRDAFRRDLADSLLGVEQVLPGPTGERNTLSLHPRGPALCLADHEAALLRQISAVLACGNQPLLRRTEDVATWVMAWPAALTQTIRWLAETDWSRLHAVLFAADSATLPALQAQVAGLPQGIVPILHPDPVDGGYALHQLVREQVLSVNTAAAGGNTSLMMLAN